MAHEIIACHINAVIACRIRKGSAAGQPCQAVFGTLLVDQRDHLRFKAGTQGCPTTSAGIGNRWDHFGVGWKDHLCGSGRIRDCGGRDEGRRWDACG